MDKDGFLQAIIEEKEADENIKAIMQCNSGVMAFHRPIMPAIISSINNNNRKQEYYLTDSVTIARQQAHKISVIFAQENLLQGIDNPLALAKAQDDWQHQRRQAFMREGVQMQAPQSVYFHHDTKIAAGTSIEPNVVFGAKVKIVGPAHIRAFSHLEGCIIEEGAIIGPYARIRPDSHIQSNARIGNFVEVKNTQFGQYAKANHLSYVGDAMIGAKTNIGAGVITCNYDGFNKHQTHIEEGVFVGSNAALVAPITIKKGAMVGAGSTLTHDVPEDALAISRTPQKILAGFAAKFKNKFKNLSKK